jgi:hypothetical protein
MYFPDILLENKNEIRLNENKQSQNFTKYKSRKSKKNVI